MCSRHVRSIRYRRETEMESSGKAWATYEEHVEGHRKPVNVRSGMADTGYVVTEKDQPKVFTEQMYAVFRKIQNRSLLTEVLI